MELYNYSMSKNRPYAIRLRYILKNLRPDANEDIEENVRLQLGLKDGVAQVVPISKFIRLVETRH